MGFALPRIILHLLLRLNVSESIRTLNEAKKKKHVSRYCKITQSLSISKPDFESMFYRRLISKVNLALGGEKLSIMRQV